jgi:hypothetical protein
MVGVIGSGAAEDSVARLASAGDEEFRDERSDFENFDGVSAGFDRGGHWSLLITG